MLILFEARKFLNSPSAVVERGSGPARRLFRGLVSDQPLISIITAVFNGEAFLPEAIASVLAQSYSNWEYWIVNDGSTDGTAGSALQAAAMHPDRIHYLQHPDGRNHGGCTSRNLALFQARGRYIAILDSDDAWLPHKLDEQVALALDYPEAGFIHGRSEYWYDWSGDPKDSGKNEVPPFAPGDRLYHPPELLRTSCPLGDCAPPCPSDMLINRELFCRLGGFETAFDRHFAFEDQAFLVKLYLATPAYVSSRVWDRYRVHGKSCCVEAERTGQIEQTRRVYYDWLREYLLARNVTDADLWRRWSLRTRCYRYPTLYRLLDKARRMKRAIRANRNRLKELFAISGGAISGG